MQRNFQPIDPENLPRKLRLIEEEKWIYAMRKQGHPLISYDCPHCNYQGWCMKPYRTVKAPAKCMDCQQDFIRIAESDGTTNTYKTEGDIKCNQ